MHCLTPLRHSAGGDEGAQLLKKMGLLDQAIEYAVESGAFAQVGRGGVRPLWVGAMAKREARRGGVMSGCVSIES